MRIIGIDPALKVTGFGIIEARDSGSSLVRAGTIITSPRDPGHLRLESIFRALEELISEFRPEVMVLEKIYSHYDHPATAFILGQARGVICLAAARSRIRLVEYSATHVKKAVVGRGLASKEQVQRMVAGTLKIKELPKYRDVTDALALALAYSYFSRAGKSNPHLK